MFKLKYLNLDIKKYKRLRTDFKIYKRNRNCIKSDHTILIDIIIIHALKPFFVTDYYAAVLY